MGAIASGGVQVLNDEVVGPLGLSSAAIDEVAAREQRELDRRERAYRGDLPPLDVAGKVVILVDDGLATGSTVRAAIEALRRQQPQRIVVAVPVGAPATCRAIGRLADEAICALTPKSFYAVGQWYDDFSEVTDDDVRTILSRSRRDDSDDESGRASNG